MGNSTFQKVKSEIKKLGDIDSIFWLDEKYQFIEFALEEKGKGIYSLILNKVILGPGAFSEIEIDYPMGLIYFKKLYAANFSRINFHGDEISID